MLALSPGGPRRTLRDELIGRWRVVVGGAALEMLASVVRDGRFPVALVEGREASTGLPTSVSIPIIELRRYV